MELLFIIAGVGLLALIVWWSENRELASTQRDWQASPADPDEASVGAFVEVTDETQDEAMAEINFVIDLREHLPQSFTYNGLPIVVNALVVLNRPPGKTTKIVSVWVGDERVFMGKYEGYIAWAVVDVPEIWSALRPRLQQIADERKAAAEAEKAAKHADILAKLGGGDGRS